MKPQKLFSRIIFIFITLSIFSCQESPSLPSDRPNILFIMADDWSYPHAGIYGDTLIQTPNFDRVANEGVLFEHAYVSSPSCTPSRASILTGQHFWRLEEGSNLYGPLRPEFPVYPDLLEQAGYEVGFTRKGWGPGIHEGRPRNPAGNQFASFEQFIEQRNDGLPFCFWFGSKEPHRGYEKGSGAEAGISPEKVHLPACFPDHEMVRADIADYYLEVQQYDAQIGELLAKLEDMGELDNTLIVVTSDNGMPFPRAKSNLYDMGTRMPLAIRWGNKINSHQRINEFVSLTDLAPSFLAAASLPIPEQMTGESLLGLMIPEETSGTKDRSHIFFGKERHVPGQESGDWGGYPMRAIRNHGFLYIKNFRPDRWPSGTPNYEKATLYPSYYGDVDAGPTRTYMVSNQDKDAYHRKLFSLAFEKRPEVELYDLNQDPDQLNNLANDPAYTETKASLGQRLMDELIQSKDHRAIGGEEIYESYPYTGGTPSPDNFKREK